MPFIVITFHCRYQALHAQKPQRTIITGLASLILVLSAQLLGDMAMRLREYPAVSVKWGKEVFA